MATLLTLHNIEKSFGPRVLFSGLNFSVSKKQQIGVIGRNGAGKSTLMKIILGQEQPDAGTVMIHDAAHIGYISQHEDEAFLSATILEHLEKSTGKPDWACKKMAAKFDLKDDMLKKTVRSFSGGYRMRVKIVEMLLHDPNFLLLDEPTNFLDLATLILLENFLQTYSGAFLIISHDREFLKRTCSGTLDVAHGTATFFDGDVEAYLAHKEKQQEFAARYNKKIEKEKAHLQAFVDRFRAKASKASAAQSKMKQIEKLKTIAIEHAAGMVRMTLPQITVRKGVALHTHELAIGYQKKDVASGINMDIERGEKIAIVGNNGEGKSTLLKTIAGRLKKKSGAFRWGPHSSVGYYAQHVAEMLKPTDTVEQYLQKEAGSGVKDQDILQMASNFLFRGDDLKKSCSMLSGGEKARLALAALLLKKHDVLLLDEPTNHLDFETVEALAAALADTAMTIFFVSHNRTFVHMVATAVIEVAKGKVVRSHHNYDNYVYHLRESLGEETLQDVPVAVRAAEKEARKALHEKIKAGKRELHALELRIAELELRRQKLHDWFAAHPTEFSEKKTQKLGKVEQALQESETAWFAQAEQLKAWEKLRAT